MADPRTITDDEIDALPTITDDEIDALPSIGRPKPSAFDKMLKVGVDTVTGVAGAPTDMFTLAMKIADMKNAFAASVGNTVLGMVGGVEPFKAIDTIDEDRLSDYAMGKGVRRVDLAPSEETELLKEPVTGSGEWLREQLPEDMRGTPAETPIGRAAQEVATFAGQNLLGMGLGGASRVARGAQAGITAAGLKRAATSAVVPALASSAAGEVDDSLRFPAVVAAEVLRGGAGAARKYASGVRRVLDEGNGLTTREAALEASGRRAAGKMTKEALGDDALAQLDSGITAREAVKQHARGGAEDFSPTTAAVTNNVKLAAAEQAMESGLHGQQSGAAILPDARTDFFTLRRQSNEAVSQAVDRLLDPQGGNPDDLRAFAQRQLDDAARTQRAAEQALEYTPAPSGAPEELGERVRHYVNDSHERARRQASRLYDAHLDAFGTEPVRGVGRMIDVLDSERTLEPRLESKRAQHVDPLLDNMYANLRRQVDDAVEARIASEGLEPDAEAAARSGIYEREAAAAMTIPYEHAVRYHQELGKAANDASVAGNADKARRLNRAQEALREVMDTGVANPQLQEGLRTANAFYRDFVNRFRVRGRPGMAARAHAPNSVDSPLVYSGDLVKKMFVPGTKGVEVAEETARALQVLDERTGQYTTNNARLSDLQNAVFDEAVRATFEPGNVAGTRAPRLPADNLQEWLTKHESALSHPIYAPVRNRLASLRTMRGDLERRAAQAGVAADDISEAVVAQMLGLDDDKAVKAFLSASPARRQASLAMLQSEPGAQNGLRRLVLNYLVRSSSSVSEGIGFNEPTLRPNKLLKLLEDHRGALTGVFDPDHLRDARRVLKGLAKSEGTREATTRGSRTTPLKSLQDALVKGDTQNTMLGGSGRHLLSLGFGVLGTQMVGRTAGAMMSAAAFSGATLASELAMGRISKMRDVSRATALRWMKDAVADPEQARVAVRFLEGDPQAIPLVRNYLWASGDLGSRNEPQRKPWREEAAGFPSEAFDDDFIADFGNFANPQPAPSPRNVAQVKGAETKRIQAADRVVTKARSAAMDAPKVARDMRAKGISIKEITKRSDESRRKPFEDLVKRSSGNLQQMLAVLEALKPEELELVRDKAQPALDKLIEGERDDMSAAEAMARADALFAPPAEEGAA